jgi:hypothetical protein
MCSHYFSYTICTIIYKTTGQTRRQNNCDDGGGVGGGGGETNHKENFIHRSYYKSKHKQTFKLIYLNT